MEECGKIDVASGANQQCSEASLERGDERNVVGTMNHVGEYDGASVDEGPPVSTELGPQDTDPMGPKEEPTHENVQQPDTWMEESVKIRQNVVDMLEYVTFQLQNTLPEESVEQLGEKIKQENDDGGVEIAKLQMPTEPVAFAGSEDEEILPDMGGSGSCLSFAAWASGNVDVKNEAPEAVRAGHGTAQDELDTETCKPAVVVAEGEDTKGLVLLSASQVFADVPPCVSQEEIVADCADNAREAEAPLPFSGTFNNFKDAEVTVEMNEEEVDVLGAASPAVKNHDYSDDDSDGSHNNMGYHREPLQQAMFHAMAPLPHNNGGNATVPYSSQVMSNIAYVRGVKREYPSEMQMQGPVRTKAARKITPPSPVKKEAKRESPSGSRGGGNNPPAKNLADNLRRQELDETFFTCDFCFKLFRRRNALMAHIKLHEALNIGNHNAHVYECRQCNKTYSSRYNLNHHTKRCHGDREHRCAKCGESYATQSDLSRHARTHGARSYKCNRCGKVFQKRKTFSAHAKVHPQVIYECITCFQKFSWEEELVDHNKIHQVPDSSPVTALTVKPDPLAPSAGDGVEPTGDSEDGKGAKHSHAMKLEYCYSYISQVKAEFADEPQCYQDFLNTIKQFKFKSIDVNQFLEQIAGIFQDHPSLIDGFNIFLPDECKVEMPVTPKKKPIVVHDPLLDRQYNPRGELDDSLAYLGQVKARFSDKPIIYNTFTYIIKEYKLNSLQIPEVAARVTSLFKDHPDLILGFNTFLPSNNRISVPCYDSQHEGSDVKLHLTEPSKKQATHGNRRDAHEDRRDAHEDSATKALGDQYGRHKNSLSNGHTISATNVDKTTASVTVNANKCAKPGAGDIARRTPPNSKANAKSRNVDPSETKADTEHGAIETNVSRSRTDTAAEIQVAGESNGQNDDVPVLEKSKLSVTDSDQCEGVADSTFTKDIMCKSSPENTNVVGTSDSASSQENIAINQDNPCGIQSVITSAGNTTSDHERKIQPPNERDYELVANSDEVATSDNEVNSVTGIDTFTNIITVSPSDPSNALPDIERSVALTNPKFPKVSVISSVATGTQHKTTKYGGKGVAFTTVNVKPSAIPKSLDASKCTERPSPTKIVPLKNSLLYQQLISQSNFRGHSNPSLATFTKIDAPGLNDKKKAFGPEPNSGAGDNSSTKINTIPNVRNPTFKSGIKISVPYIVNSPNSNVIFTLANTMVDDSSKVHGSADNPNLITSTDSSGLESNQNSNAVYAVAGSNTPTSSANVAMISTNTLQNVSSTNSYTGLNIVTSTNIAPSTYTLANTKSIASFPAAVPTGNGPNKQMLLIRTNPPSNTFFIANSGSRLLSSDSTLHPGCLVPITKTASNVNSSEVNAPNSNVNEATGTQCALPNKMLALATKTFATLANNKVGKPNFMAGQKIAIVKTSIADKTMGNAKTARALTASNAAPDTVVNSNVVNVSGAKRYPTNTIGNTITSPKKRKLAPNRIATAANVSVKKKTDSAVRTHTYRNRPLLPASSNNSQTPFVVSFLPNAAGDAQEENEPEPSMPVCSTPVPSDQSNSQVVRTYERSIGNKPEETVLEQLGICNNIQNTQIVKTKAARKQCLIVKTVSVTDDLKPSGLEHNGILGSELCPKTYSRRDSLTKRVVETHSTDMDLS